MPVLLTLLALFLTTLGGVPSTPADDWRGSPDAVATDYPWIGDYRPSDTYGVVVVRGLRPRAVLATLGVKRQLRDMGPWATERWVINHLDRSYSGPRALQVDRRGPATVVYAPSGWVSDEDVERLSRRGLAVGFSTTVEIDTWVVVAREGEVVRAFDPFWRPRNAVGLPEEEGLETWRRQPWRTSWAFMERLSRVRISKEWFAGKHPTYVRRGRG